MNLPGLPRCLSMTLMAMLLAPALANAGTTASNGSPRKLEGEWFGRSLCVTSRPACTDETVRYRLTVADDAGASIRFDMDKLVGGKYEPMGSLDCRFQAQRQLLACPAAYGDWLFRWDGEALLGSLSVREDGLFRHIHVVRQATKAPASPR